MGKLSWRGKVLFFFGHRRRRRRGGKLSSHERKSVRLLERTLLFPLSSWSSAAVFAGRSQPHCQFSVSLAAVQIAAGTGTEDLTVVVSFCCWQATSSSSSPSLAQAKKCSSSSWKREGDTSRRQRLYYQH